MGRLKHRPRNARGSGVLNSSFEQACSSRRLPRRLPEALMKVFISSLISGMEAERAAAKSAIELLRHQAVMAEDFGAQPNSPQVACLNGLRQSDLVVLILSTRYGAKQASGLSATHEEYREARGAKPILTFIQQGEAEADQAALIGEAGSWESGLFRESFSTPEELGKLVTRALHDYAVAHASAPVDPASLVQRAQQLLPGSERGRSSVALHVAIAAGPEGTILRPSELESTSLSDEMQRQALFGSPALFDRRVGTDSRLEAGALVIFQERSYDARSEIRLWGSGDMRFVVPVRDQEDRSGMGLPVVIEESVSDRLAGAFSYSAWLLTHIDRTERVSHVAIATALVGEGAMGWRTRSEHAASPRSGSFGGFGNQQDREQPVMLTPAHRVRAALTMDASRMGEDFVVLLRRRWKD